MKRTINCLICEATYDDNDLPTVDSPGGAVFGVCDACRENAAMGARARGMTLMSEDIFDSHLRAAYMAHNNCLRAIKEGV